MDLKMENLKIKAKCEQRTHLNTEILWNGHMHSCLQFLLLLTFFWLLVIQTRHWSPNQFITVLKWFPDSQPGTPSLKFTLCRRRRAFPFLALRVPLHQGHTNPRPGLELHESYRIALCCQLNVIAWFPFDPKEGKFWMLLSYFNTCTHSTSPLWKLISWLVVWGCFWDLSPVRWRCMRIAQKLQSF